MCGIVAVLTKSKFGFYNKSATIFNQLLLVGQVRGQDGTGIFYNIGKTGNKTKINKAGFDSSSFLAHPEYQKAVKTIIKDSTFIVGHNRSATKGEITAEHAHPFREKHIVLVHNGTIFNQKELNKEAVVDSHAICHSLADFGYEKTLKDIHGAFALVWFDSNKNTLYLCRNSQRPLYLIETKDFYVAVSELEMGKWILHRNNEPIISSTLLTPEILYKFEDGDFSKYSTEKVEYKSFGLEMWPVGTTTTTTTPPKVYKEKTKIKFRPGMLIKGISLYLEGDILEDTNIPKDLRTNSNYEGTFRVRVYQNEETLRKLQAHKHLEGEVAGTSERFGKVCVFASDVVEEKDTTSICEFCQVEFDKDTRKHYVDGYLLCPECATTMCC